MATTSNDPRLAPTDPLIPPWEMCKVCGGDHWTKDHPDLRLPPEKQGPMPPDRRTDPRLAPLAAALLDLFPAVQRDRWPFTPEQAAAAILAALPPDWCGHVGVEEVIAQGQARIATLDARIVALNAEVLDRMDQWHRDSLARDELARQQNREIARLRAIEEAARAGVEIVYCKHGNRGDCPYGCGRIVVMRWPATAKEADHAS